MTDAEIMERVESTHDYPGVYFVTNSHGIVKIGHAENVIKRVEKLSVKYGQLKIEHIIRHPTKSAARLHEHAIHKLFRKEKFRHEWFYFSDRIKAFISKTQREGK